MSKIQLIVILLSILNVFGNTLVNEESCNSGDKISLSGECIYYRLCENNNYVTKKCPRKAINNIGELSQQMFDAIKKECVDKRKVIVSDKCNSYRECIINESISPIEKWVESYCPSTLHFDELTQKCIESKLTNCTVCLSNLCKNDGICKEDNKKGGYECFCKPGFKGNNCEINSNKTVCFDSETYFTNGKGEHICNFLSDKKENKNNKTEICEPKKPMTLEDQEVNTVSFSPDAVESATEKQLIEFQDWFTNVYDKDGDGMITLEEFETVMYKFGWANDVSKMFCNIDKDGDGKVNFKEYVQVRLSDIAANKKLEEEYYAKLKAEKKAEQEEQT